MKINSIGVDAYRQMSDNTRTIRKPDLNSQSESASKSAVKLSIPTQNIKGGSKISVKLQGKNLMGMLSTEEKQALDLLFEKFGEKKATDKDSPGTIGNFVDVKL
jgi:hypothetical protein